MLKAISLYTGVGGLDFGFEAAGFETAVAVDLDHVACATIGLNRQWPVLEGDIESISSRKILKAAGLKPGEADVLIGGPPCQPFSKSGYWANGDAKRLDDPRAQTLREYLRVLRDTRPRVFLLENVHGFVFRGKDEALHHIQEGVAEVNRKARTNYRLYWQKLNAASYGVPQMRDRVFLVASRDGRPFTFPAATHRPAEEIDADLEPYRTAWDAIGDLPARPNDPAVAVGGKVGRLAADHSRRRELSLAYEPGRRRAAVRLAHTVLELPFEAQKGSTVVDHTSAAWSRDGTVPLVQSPANRTRALPAANLPRWPPVRVRTERRSKASRQRRAVASCRGARA